MKNISSKNEEKTNFPILDEFLETIACFYKFNFVNFVFLYYNYLIVSVFYGNVSSFRCNMKSLPEAPRTCSIASFINGPNLVSQI